jgi:hypothetical protein
MLSLVLVAVSVLDISVFNTFVLWLHTPLVLRVTRVRRVVVRVAEVFRRLVIITLWRVVHTARVVIFVLETTSTKGSVTLG